MDVRRLYKVAREMEIANQTRIARLEGENNALHLEIENYGKKLKILETSVTKADLEEVKSRFDQHQGLHPEVDLTPLIESKEYLDKCVQEVQYMLQSTSLDQQFEVSSPIPPLQSEEYFGREQQQQQQQQQQSQTVAVAMVRDSHPSKLNASGSPSRSKGTRMGSEAAANNSSRSPRSSQTKSSILSSSLPSTASSSTATSTSSSSKSSPTNNEIMTNSNINIENIGNSKLHNTRILPQGDKEVNSTTREYGEWHLQYTIDSSRQRSSMRAIAFVEDSLPCIADDDGNLQLWDTARETPQPSPLVSGHEGLVSALRYSKSTNQLFSAGQDRTVRTWSVPNKTKIQSIDVTTAHDDFIWDLALHDESSRLASASSDGTVKIWNVQNKQKKLLTKITGFHDNTKSSVAAISVSFFDQGRQLIVGYEDSDIQLIDIETGTKILSFDSSNPDSNVPTEFRPSIVNVVTYSHADNLVLSAHADGSVRHFDPATGHCLFMAPNAHTGSATCLSCSPAGQEFVTGGEEGSVKIWSIGTRSVVQELQQHQALEGVLALSWRTPRLLATVGDDSIANFYTR